MAKFKVGDKVRITANGGTLDVANISVPALKKGTVGTVLDIDLSCKYPYLVAWSGDREIWTNVKYLEGVEISPEFKVGDTVYLLEGAHGSTYTYSSPTPQRFLEHVRDSDISFTDPWTIVNLADDTGDVLIKQNGDTAYILEKFLTKENPVVTLSEIISSKPVPETVEVAKLLEANDFLGHFDAGLLMDVIKLSQRLK